VVQLADALDQSLACMGSNPFMGLAGAIRKLYHEIR